MRLGHGSHAKGLQYRKSAARKGFLHRDGPTCPSGRQTVPPSRTTLAVPVPSMTVRPTPTSAYQAHIVQR
jgi:hypothetical protein